MARFTYVSRDTNGQRVTAVAEASSRQDLLGQLKDRGLTVVEVKELGEQAAEAKARRKGRLKAKWYVRAVSTGELSVFWRELATMVNAGLPVVEALRAA